MRKRKVFPRAAASPRVHSPRLYWRASGAFLAVLAIAGLALVATGRPRLFAPLLNFDTVHNGLHVGLAAIALAIGFAPIPPVSLKRLALGFGIVYLVLAIVGFLSPTAFGFGARLGLRFELVENVAHLALGAWGAYVGTHEE